MECELTLMEVGFKKRVMTEGKRVTRSNLNSLLFLGRKKIYKCIENDNSSILFLPVAYKDMKITHRIYKDTHTIGEIREYSR